MRKLRNPLTDAPVRTAARLFGTGLAAFVVLAVALAGCAPSATDIGDGDLTTSGAPEQTRTPPEPQRPPEPQPPVAPALPASSAWEYADHVVSAVHAFDDLGALGSVHVGFTPDGSYLVALTEPSGDPRITFFEYSDGLTPVCTVTTARDTRLAENRRFAIAPDSRSLAFGGRGGRVVIVEIGPDCRVRSEIQVGDGDITGVAFSPDGRWLYAASRRSLHRIPAAFDGPPLSVDTGTGGSGVELMVASRHYLHTREHYTLQLRSLGDADFGQVLSTRLFRNSFIMAMDASEIGSSGATVFAAGLQDSVFVQWFGDSAGEVGIPVQQRLVDVRLAADGTAVVTVDNAGTVRVWDYRAQAATFRYEPEVGEGRPVSAAFSPDGAYLAWGTQGRAPGRWDDRGSEPLLVLGARDR